MVQGVNRERRSSLAATGHRDAYRTADRVDANEVAASDSIEAATGSVDVDVDDPASDPTRVELAASTEPAIVFASLAAHCALQLCDEATVDILDGTHARYRIAYPPRGAGGGLMRIAERAGSTADHQARVPFANPQATRVAEGGSSSVDGFHGVATFVWHYRTPTRAERLTVDVLVEHAVKTVLWQRSEHAAREATAHAAHLKVALETSRRIGAAIGILMSLHKITEDQAFELLRLASQNCNRKLRDLALEVVDTGWLDPGLLNSSRRVTQSVDQPTNKHVGQAVSRARRG